MAKKAKKGIKAKSSTKTKETPAVRSNGKKGGSIFDGASEVRLTKNKIVVTRTKTNNKPGKYERSETREYIDKTPQAMAEFNRFITSVPTQSVGVRVNSSNGQKR